MAKFVLISTNDGTFAVNPATISYIERCKGDVCILHFVGGEALTLKQSYSVVTDYLVKGAGFKVQE